MTRICCSRLRQLRSTWHRDVEDESLHSIIDRAAFYVEAFTEDIFPNIRVTDFERIGCGTIGLFVYIKALDNFVDSKSEKTAGQFLALANRIEKARLQFSNVWIRASQARLFETLWHSSTSTTFSALHARQRGELKSKSAWKMSAFVALCPASLLAARNSQRADHKDEFERSIRDWQRIVQHVFTAKQMMDDLHDFPEDLSNHTRTEITDQLLSVTGTEKAFKGLAKVMQKHLQQTELELSAAKQLLESRGSCFWTKVCDGWREEVARHQCSR